jgi:hypothetical protein
MKKQKMSLDTWVDMPEDMKKYLQNYGYHFNHKIYRFAVSKMYKKTKDGKDEKIEPVEKEKVQEMLKKYNITLENDEMYDSTYLYSMAMADFMGVAFDEATTAKWIKARIDDVDRSNGYLFNEWWANMCFEGIPIDWEEYI